jgi:hypothetical protein
MRAGDPVIVLPCGHTFHSPCIDNLVVHQHMVCPLCRKPIPVERSTTGARTDTTHTPPDGGPGAPQTLP